VEFETLVKERRSANNFVEAALSEKELEEIFGLVKYAPSCFNLQHAHFVVVNDPEQKAKVHKAAYGQYKVHSASAAIVVLGDTRAHEQAERLYEGTLALRIISQEEYEQTIAGIKGLYASGGAGFQRDEAIRNASLAAMVFMLAAKDKGWDTCPMIGFDPDQIREICAAPDHLLPVMLITIGKEKVESRRMRGYRKPVGEFVTYNKFSE